METDHRVIFRSAADMLPLDRGSVDLVVTSPPYPMIEMWDAIFAEQDGEIEDCLSRGDGGEAFQRMHNILDAVWRECARVVKDGGFVCINIGDATRSVAGTFRLFPNHARIISACEDLGLYSLPAVIWRKPANGPNKFMGSGMLPAGAYITLEHEYILVFRKGDRRTPGQDDGERVRRRRSAFFWEERNIWFSDVWDLRGSRQSLRGSGGGRERSGAFPVELAFRLINMYSLQGDVVLDPFLGTGTTTLAAMATGRSSLGVDVDAGLEPVVRDTVERAPAWSRERQKRRLEDHDDFVRRYTSDKGYPPKYVNEPHGIPVVTRQETDLMLPVVTEIRDVRKGESEGPFGSWDLAYRLRLSPLY
jgi:modification methylase